MGCRYPKVDGGGITWYRGAKAPLHVGSNDWKLMPELEIEEDDIIIDEKRRYDAFYGTILGDILRQYKVTLLSELL